MKKKILIFIFSLFLFSCGNKVKNSKDISNRELNEILNNSIVEYSQKKDKKVLETAYNSLNKNKDFREFGLVNGISNSTIGVLMGLGKYDELEKLLNENKIMDYYNKTNILNTVRYLKFKDKDLPKAKLYIAKSLKMIKETIDKKPNDSLRYADYFSMRMFLVGKKETLKEVDSMKAVNKRYSDIFYDAILKDALESYPDEYLPK